MSMLMDSVLDPERMADIRRNDAAMERDLRLLQSALLDDRTMGMQTLWQKVFGAFWAWCGRG